MLPHKSHSPGRPSRSRYQSYTVKQAHLSELIESSSDLFRLCSGNFVEISKFLSLCGLCSSFSSLFRLFNNMHRNTPTPTMAALMMMVSRAIGRTIATAWLSLTTRVIDSAAVPPFPLTLNVVGRAEVCGSSGSVLMIMGIPLERYIEGNKIVYLLQSTLLL